MRNALIIINAITNNIKIPFINYNKIKQVLTCCFNCEKQ